MLLGLVAMLLAACGAPPSVAQSAPPSVAEVEAWLRKEAAEAVTYPDLRSCRIQWVRERHWYPTAAEFERLDREVPGRPDHPERSAHESYQRHRAGSPTITPRTAWVIDAGTWRLSEGLAGPGFKAGMFWDKVVTAKYAFSLLDDTITILDPREGWPAGQDFRKSGGELFGNLNRFYHGGVPGDDGRTALGRVTIEGTEWRAVFVTRASGQNLGPPSFSVSGRWDVDAGRGFAEQVLRLGEGGAGSGVLAVRAGDYRWFPDLDRWLAQLVEEFDETGRLRTRLKLEKVDPVPADTLRAVFDIPEPGGQDAFRGVVTARAVFDMRTGIQSNHTAEGVVKVPIPGAALTPHAGSGRRLRLTGWLGGGGIAAVIAILCIIKHHRAERGNTNTKGRTT
jgi:hypothetical protein